MHRLEAPRARVVPVVVEVPHASVALPEEVRPLLLVDAPTLRRDADSYVDELYRDAPDHGAALLVAGVSRYVVDLNREEHDLDGGTVQGVVREGEAAPRGVIWRETGEAGLTRRTRSVRPSR